MAKTVKIEHYLNSTIIRLVLFEKIKLQKRHSSWNHDVALNQPTWNKKYAIKKQQIYQTTNGSTYLQKKMKNKNNFTLKDYFVSWRLGDYLNISKCQVLNEIC
jgi:hypothetical protein